MTIPEAFTNFVTVTLPNAINSMITFFNQIPYYLGYAIGLGIGYIAKFALGIYKFATVQLPQYIAAIIKWFSQLPSKMDVVNAGYSKSVTICNASGSKSTTNR